MRNIMLVIEYDGTGYNGWQTQRNKTTIQETIESALRSITNEETELIGASRTDSGVHALGQTANFVTSSKIKVERIPFALNSLLPKDIAVTSAEEVSYDFHARFSSKGKKYKYTILNSEFPSPLRRSNTYFYPTELNIDNMKMACSYFIGEHNFDAFRSAGGSAKSSVRTIYSLELITNNDLIEINIDGNGFLYNMVRIIVGTLIDVGRGKIIPADIINIIKSGDRKLAGKTVPAHGLCLMEVYY